jgi:hypothetical protein
MHGKDMEIVDIELLQEPEMFLVPVIIPGWGAEHRGFIDQIGRVADSLEKKGLPADSVNNPGSFHNISEGRWGALLDSRASRLRFYSGAGKNKTWQKEQPGRYKKRWKNTHMGTFCYFMALARMVI